MYVILQPAPGREGVRVDQMESYKLSLAHVVVPGRWDLICVYSSLVLQLMLNSEAKETSCPTVTRQPGIELLFGHRAAATAQRSLAERRKCLDVSLPRGHHRFQLPVILKSRMAHSEEKQNVFIATNEIQNLEMVSQESRG